MVDMVTRVPLDFETAMADPDWRRRLAWPIRWAPYSVILREQQERLLRLIAAAKDDEARNILLLGAGRIFPTQSFLVHLALGVQAESQSGIRLTGPVTDLDFLRDGAETKRYTITDGPAIEQPFEARWPALRRLLRTSSWTPLRRLPAAIWAPSAVAISHNALLRDALARGGRSVGFSHAQAILDRAHRQGGAPAEPEKVAPLVAALTESLTEIPSLDADLRRRLAFLIRRRATKYLEQAQTDMACLARVRRLPRQIWSANGGYYPARAVALEVMRRGGDVTSVDHGGTIGTIDNVSSIAFTQMAVTNRFLSATPKLAECVKALKMTNPVSGFRDVVVAAHDGDPTFRLAARTTRRGKSRRPTVVYVTTAMLGFRQVMPPILPDLVYLDWNLRLAETLRSLPIELICRPHPEGLLAGRRPPLADIARCAAGPFAKLIEAADVFLLDCPQTTTLWEVVCTDRPVVFIDLGLAAFSRPVAPMMAARVTTICATFDENNLPQVDREELVDALLSTAPPDPAPLRALLGEASVAP